MSETLSGSRSSADGQGAVPFLQSQASVLLDLVRGLAALLVLLNHWRNILFLDYRQLGGRCPWLAPLYLLCSAGHQAVVIFFVLSGYLIGGSVFRLLESGKWSWRNYLAHRLLRLWIVLLPGLVLCALWDGIGLHSDLAPRLYAGLSGDHVVTDVHASYTVSAFFGSAAFLQTIRTAAFGSDGALWSLANEFWYYLLFPLGVLALRSQSGRIARTICLALFLAVAWMVGPRILESFPIWLLGAGLALLPAPHCEGRFASETRWLAASLYLSIFFLLGRVVPLGPLQQDYLLAIATFGLLWVLLGARSACRPSLGERFSRGMSRFSYTLYVGHTPLCVLLAALAVGEGRWTPDAVHLSAGFCLLAVLLLYAYGVAYLTEFRTDRVRRWLEPRWLASARPQARPDTNPDALTPGPLPRGR